MPYEFREQVTAVTHGLCQWHFNALEACSTPVMPDGCQDIIVTVSDKQPCLWYVSNLSEMPFTVHSEAGEYSTGIRLMPGAQVDAVGLQRWLAKRCPSELMESDTLNEFVRRSDRADAILECLASDVGSVDAAARQLGVSVRALQRQTLADTGRSPKFWMSLARVRRTARALIGPVSLTENALLHGFADQAHMTRDFRRWLGVTPRQWQRSPQQHALLSDWGYG